jgi:hypothetical protein
MSSIAMPQPTENRALPVAPSVRRPERDHDRSRRFQRLARMTGVLFLITYATSIPPVLSLYVPALSDPAFVLGGGFDRGVSWGALLELVLILANIGSALALYPVLRRRLEILSLGFVAARIMESAFIAVGVLALMALNTLRLQVGDADPATLAVVGQALVAVHDWTFRLGPGVVVGVGNGVILGWMMWRTRLVPRALSGLGLIGGPALLVAGIGILFGAIEVGSTAQVVATIPEFLWELGFGLWLVVRGFDLKALDDLNDRRS